MIGNGPPEIVKPVPLTVAALTVTAAVPVDVRISDWVAGEPIFTLPKAIVVAFTLSVGTPVSNCNAKVSATLFALAVKITL